MKITGYRSLTTYHEWDRPIGDVNYAHEGTRTPVSVLVVETDEGIEGVGVGPHPDIERVFDAVVGEDPRSVVALYDRMCDHVFKFGHQGFTAGAIGALDMALWDVKAKAADEPLWRLLGGRDRFVPGYASALDMHLGDEELARLHGRFVEHGFRAVKLKGGRLVEDDLRRLLLLREVYSANSAAPGLMLDANEAWHRSQAVRHIRRLERELDLTWVEEPVRRWDAAGLAAVRTAVSAGVASGENLTGLEQFVPLLAADALDVVQVGWGWGTTFAQRVSLAAHSRGLPVSPVGFTPAVAAAATAMPNMLTIEVQDLGWPVGLVADMDIADGGYVLGDRPGNGFSVDADALRSAAEEPPRVVGNHTRPPRASLHLSPEEWPTYGTQEPTLL